MKKLILGLCMLLGLSFAISADTFRVIRDGDLVKTTAPIISELKSSATTLSVSATITPNMAIVITLNDGSTANLLIRQ